MAELSAEDLRRLPMETRVVLDAAFERGVPVETHDEEAVKAALASSEVQPFFRSRYGRLRALVRRPPKRSSAKFLMALVEAFHELSFAESEGDTDCVEALYVSYATRALLHQGALAAQVNGTLALGTDGLHFLGVPVRVEHDAARLFVKGQRVAQERAP